jgi:hypothetical protein
MFSRSFSKVVGGVEDGDSVIPCRVASLVDSAESLSNEYLGRFSRRFAVEYFLSAGELKLGIPHSEDEGTIYRQGGGVVQPAESVAAFESSLWGNRGRCSKAKRLFGVRGGPDCRPENVTRTEYRVR